MKSVTFHCIRFVVLSAVACSVSAQAAYSFIRVTYQGADATQLWGITNAGQVLGQAQYSGAPTVNFLYDMKLNTFTLLPSVAGHETNMLDINDAGGIVGSVFDNQGIETAFIRGTTGSFTMFSHAAPSENTEARGVNDAGLVTGFAYDDAGSNFVGFVYDPVHRHFFDLPFVGSPQIIVQGINASGQAVGSVVLPDSGAYADYPLGVYGFLREGNGAITLFQVNGISTRARGITDSGEITGWTRPLGAGHHATGFVGTFVGASFQTLNVPNASDTFPAEINNAGQIVGSADGNGFVATPIATDKNQCKSGGWQFLSRADATFFKNQGDCIQYANTGK